MLLIVEQQAFVFGNLISGHAVHTLLTLISFSPQEKQASLIIIAFA